MTKKTTITWTSVTIKLHQPQKYSINGNTQDNLSDAEINATNQFVVDWVRTHPELFRMVLNCSEGIANQK